MPINNSPALKKWGLYWIWVVRHSICHSVPPSQFCFPSISWEQNDRILPNFVYALVLTRFRSGLLHIIFHTFVLELWPLTDVRILFPSISWEQINRIGPNFVCALILTRSRLRSLPVIFRKFVRELWPLNYVTFSCPLNILGTNW